MAASIWGNVFHLSFLCLPLCAAYFTDKSWFVFFKYSLNCSTNSQSVLAKTPKRTETSFSNNKTPKMTQGPTLGKPNSWKSPAVGGGACRKAQNILGDRMVPSRSTTDFEAAHHKMTSEESSGDRVLSYQTVQIPKPQEAYINHQKVFSAIHVTADHYLLLWLFTGSLLCHCICTKEAFQPVHS